MSDGFEKWSILIGLIGVVSGAYVLAWRGRLSGIRRGASLIVALFSTLAALLATGYAIEGLGDIHSPEVSLWTVLVGELIMSSISICAWVIAIRFAIIALRKAAAQRLLGEKYEEGDNS